MFLCPQWAVQKIEGTVYRDLFIRLDFTKQLLKSAGRTYLFHNILEERSILKTVQIILKE